MLFSRITATLSVYQPERRRAVYWRRTAEAFPYFERAAPLRTLLHLWLANEGLQLTHAAALGDADGCLLLAGRAGSGKSSAALACLDSDLGHIADDFCVLAPGSPAVAHALYSSTKAHPDTLERLAIDTSMVANPVREQGDKAVIFLNDHFSDRLVERAPIRAVVVPVISAERETRAEPCSAGFALAALAPSTLLQLPGTGVGTMRPIVDLVRSAPTYRLEAGTDPAGIAPALSAILRG